MAGAPSAKTLLARVRRSCLALPGVTEEPAWIGTRWLVRRKTFAHLLEIRDGQPPAYARAAGHDGPVVVLTFRASDLLRDSLRETGRFFVAPWGTTWKTKVVGIVLDGGTDWAEVAELLGEAHRLFVPSRAPARRR